MFIIDYFEQVENIISGFPAVIQKEIFYDQRTLHIGFIKGNLTFNDSSQLFFKEFIDTENGIIKYKYAYHYQKADKIIFRYDNHLGIHHKHTVEGEYTNSPNASDLESILLEILTFL